VTDGTNAGSEPALPELPDAVEAGGAAVPAENVVDEDVSEEVAAELDEVAELPDDKHPVASTRLAVSMDAVMAVERRTHRSSHRFRVPVIRGKRFPLLAAITLSSVGTAALMIGDQHPARAETGRNHPLRGEISRSVRGSTSPVSAGSAPGELLFVGSVVGSWWRFALTRHPGPRVRRSGRCIAVTLRKR
jgi:hypothetical protein